MSKWKKRKKRIPAALLSALLLLLVCSNVYAAETSVRFGSESYRYEMGETFPIGIYLEADTPIETYDVCIEYDPDVMEYQSGGDSHESGKVYLKGGNGEKESYKRMLYFTTKKEEASKLRITETVIQSPDGERHTVTTQEDVVVALGDAVFHEETEKPQVETPKEPQITEQPEKEDAKTSEEQKQDPEADPGIFQKLNQNLEKLPGSTWLYVVIAAAVVILVIAIALMLRIRAIRRRRKRRQRIREKQRLKQELMGSSTRQRPEKGRKPDESKKALDKGHQRPVEIVQKSAGKKPPVEKTPKTAGQKPDRAAAEKSSVSQMETAASTAPVVISVQDVCMYFKIAIDGSDSLKEYMIRALKHQNKYRELKALDHISFDVHQGEVVGIIGTNGSGKSTLLKIVSGAMGPTSGKVVADKKKIQLLTLGTGFDRELTARENVYLNGAIIGYTKEYIDEKYDEIVKFAELEGFMEERVKNFSSGMVSRLGFAIATTRDTPDILILDEVLSVGDMFFRKKSHARIQEMIHSGATVLIVSHSTDTILKNCTKAVWIEKGIQKMVGDPKTVCAAYQAYGQEER